MPEAAGDGAKGWRHDLRVVRALLVLAGPVALAGFVVLAARPALELAHQRLRHAIRNVREPEAAALARFRTPAYVAALEKIRRTIPETAAYYLVPADDGHGDYFVRFDLAPRRPLLVEALPSGPPPPDAPRWVVLARMDPPGPEVLETAEYFSRESRR